MRLIKTILFIFPLLFLSACSLNRINKFRNLQEDDINRHSRIIDDYLRTKSKEPNVIVNSISQEQINFFDINIKWKAIESGVLIIVNGDTINTKEAITLNDVWDSGKDSVNFANYLLQVKYYDLDEVKLLGFVLNNSPCTGLGCSVNYQLIYDLEKKTTNYFGRFRTGEDLELYDFSNDFSGIDYVSNTFHGRNESLIDTTVFEIFRRDTNGTFHLVKDSMGNRYYLKLINSWERYTFPDKMETYWPEKIIN